MAKLPTALDLGVHDANPSMGVATYNPNTGLEGVQARNLESASRDFGQSAAIFARAADEQAQIAAADAENRYKQSLIDQEQNPETGWSRVEKGNANQEFLRTQLERATESKNQIADEITDQRTRDMFLRRAAVSEISHRSALMKHTSQEMTKHKVEVFQTGQETDKELLAKTTDDTAAHTLILGMMTRAVETAKSLGISKEGLALAASDAYSNAMAARINAALYERNNTAEAMGLFGNAKTGMSVPDPSGAMNPDGTPKLVKVALSREDTVKFGKELNHRGELDKYLKTGLELKSTMGPKSKDEPFLIEPMLEKFMKDNPGFTAAEYDGVRNVLSREKQIWDSDVAQAGGKALGELSLMVTHGASVDALKRTPQYLTLTAAQKATIEDKALDHQYRTSLRLSAAEERDWRRIQRKESELRFNGAMETYELLSDKDKLFNMTKERVQALATTLGQENTGHLMMKWASLHDPSAQQIDAPTVKSVLLGAGFNIKPKENQKEAAVQLNQAESAIHEAIQNARKASAKPLTVDEQRKVAQSVVDNKVLLSRWLGLSSKEVPAVSVTKEKADDVIIPAGQGSPVVPRNIAYDYAELIRGYDRLPDNMSPEEIIRLYGDRIARAHKMTTIPGAGNAQVSKILRGDDIRQRR